MSRKSGARSTWILVCMTMFLLPTVLATVSVEDTASEPQDQEWWVNTTVDRDGNGIGDMIEVHQKNPYFLDAEKTLPLIIDFDHTPGDEEIQMLSEQVNYQHQWTLEGIDALAGRVPVGDILTASRLQGVVMLELDGILEVTNGDAAVLHGVDTVWQDTGYDGAGSTVAIIDTGIDGNHSSLDDHDDDPLTNDPKVIGFYDPVNNPSLTNGTEVFAYDDQGHGSHCAGTTAGTGAPTYEHIGMAPQASLVGVKVLDAGGSGSFATVMAGMEWTVENRYKFNIRAASMSLGGPGAIEWTSSEEDSVNRYANEMVRAGIALFIAAGNTAVSAQIGTPGSAEDAITVGALDKNSAIAVYSSQGPTEEGRVKPNIAYVGSNVMSVAFNTGDQYTDMSGTSMATPGAAGVAALMLQANPDLSPFDIRNIMQETATYRQCAYMLANEPCAEDLIPKNRQNNVYGHGEVRALDAVLEAAQEDYEFDTSISVVVSTTVGMDNRIHLDRGDSVGFDVVGDIETVQWRSNHLRDDWSNIHGFDKGNPSGELYLIDIVHQLEHLPGTDVMGNHTISLRGIQYNESGGQSSSTPLVTAEVMIMNANTDVITNEESEGLPAVGIIGTMAIIGLGIAASSREEDTVDEQ
ncbi:S8 family serine peptidase [bacterium]|nr:S8 family serine peptidase [Candidatus Poseidoniales archaeon]MDB2367733.1 S8 family serine peptidase [Candidatus Poseidoniales archaeon]MDB3879263.1 S8 family serine peptidase [bacterium]